MSAPHEVWCVVWDDGTLHGEVKEKPGSDGRDVRYLRADLTCNDCKKSILGIDCPHDSMDEGSTTSNGEAACMAFVPRPGR